MRKLTYSAAVSLDGYIAGSDEAVDWILWSEDSNAIMTERWKGVDTMLIGRRTFDFMQRSGAGGGSSRINTYVFSRTLETVPEGMELVRSDSAAFVAALKREKGGAIFLMGGGVLAASLIGAGLVDELAFSIHPVLLGGGTPTFGTMDSRTQVELVECRGIAKGCVHVRYRLGGG
jgi:dihydrofolate reductase